MYLLLVLVNLNISPCYWCIFLRINTLGQSMPYKAVTVQLPPNFVLSLIFTVHCQMQPTVQARNVELINVDAVSKLIWYRFIGNWVRDIFLVHTKIFYACFNNKSVHEFRSHYLHAISL